MSKTHQPWLKLWAMDELFAGPIRAAALPTQAVYMRLMAVAHQSDPYGVIEPAGKRGMERTARLACVSLDELQEAWAEMEELGIVEDGRLVFRRLQEDREELEEKRRRAKRGTGADTPPADASHLPTRASARDSAPDLRSGCAPAAPQLREICAETAPKSAPDLRSGCAHISELRFSESQIQIRETTTTPPNPPADAGGRGGSPDREKSSNGGPEPDDTPTSLGDPPPLPAWSAPDPEFWAMLRRKRITTRASSAIGTHLAAMVAEHALVAGRPYAEVAPRLWAHVEANASIWNPMALIRYATSILESCRVRNVLPGEQAAPAWEREALDFADALENMQ